MLDKLLPSVHNKLWLWLIMPLLIVLTVLIIVHNTTLVMPAFLLLLLITAWLISRFNLQAPLMGFIAFTLPFSFEIPVFQASMISLPAEPLIGLAAFTLLMDVLRRPGLIKDIFGKEVLWALPLLIAYPLTALFSGMPVVSAKFTLVNVSFLLVFLIFLNHLFRKNPALFPKMMILYSAGLAVVFAWAVYRYWQYGWNPVVVKGIFQPFYRDYTIFGATAAIAGMYWFVCAGRLKPASFKILAYTAAMFFISAVVVSASRAAALSLVFAVVLLLMLRLRLHIRHLTMLALALVLLIVVSRSAILETLHQNTYVSRSHDLEWGSNIKSAGNITTDVSNIERLNRWYSGIKLFLEKPLTGFGPGTYQFVYIPYQKKELMNRLTVTSPWNIPENSGGTAHSEYILALSEMGLIGFLGLILLFGRLVWIAFTKVRTHTERHLLVVAFAALSTYFFHSFFNNFLNTDKFAFLFWGMAAWLMALNERDHERELLL